MILCSLHNVIHTQTHVGLAVSHAAAITLFGAILEDAHFGAAEFLDDGRLDQRAMDRWLADENLLTVIQQIDLIQFYLRPYFVRQALDNELASDGCLVLVCSRFNNCVHVFLPYP